MDILSQIPANPYPDVNTKIISDVYAALEEKYGEEFEIIHIGNRFFSSSVTLHVRSKRNAGIVFTMKADRSGKMEDDYIKSIIAKRIADHAVEVLRENGFNASACVSVSTDALPKDDASLPVNEFMKKNGIDSALLTLIVERYGKGPEHILPALTAVSLSYDFKLVADVYILPSEAFADCSEHLEQFPSVSEAYIRRYAPVFSFRTALSLGESSLPAETLKAMAEE